MATINGRGDFPFSSVWPTRIGLTPEQFRGNSDQDLQTALEQWFFQLGVPINDSIGLRISTIDFWYSPLDLFIPGYDTKSNEVPLFIFNSETITTSGDLFINGYDFVSGTIGLVALNLIPATGQLNLVIHAPLPSSGTFPLFITGYRESIQTTLFMAVDSKDIATSRSFHIYGSPIGVDYSFTGQKIPLFVKSKVADTIWPPLAYSVTSLFMQAIDGTTSNNAYWSLFLNSNTVINNDLSLYVSTYEPIVSGTMDLFIARIPDYPAQDGYTPINTYQTLFLETLPGTQQELELYISGIPGPSNEQIDCFVKGILGINDTLPLLLYGISGAINDSVDLCLYGIGELSDPISLFVRGY
jgi:hypothetical protein